MTESLPTPQTYPDLLATLKARIRDARLRTAVSVNQELILLYWEIGRDILLRQAAEGWGTAVIDRLARDLRRDFPEMTGLSLLDVANGKTKEREIYSETFYPRLHLGWSDLASLLGGRYHFIEGPDPELYDLTQDQKETVNLRDRERRGILARRLDGHPGRDPRPLGSRRDLARGP